MTIDLVSSQTLIYDRTISPVPQKNEPNISTIVEEELEACEPSQCEYDLLFQYLCENNIMDDCCNPVVGLEPLPPLPPLTEDQLVRFGKLFGTLHITVWKLSKKFVVEAKPTTKQEIFARMGFPFVKAVGGVGPWLLGVDYFLRLFSGFKVPSRLLPTEFIELISQHPHDVDIRLPAPQVDDSTTNMATEFLFKQLSDHFNLSYDVIKKSLINKGYTREGNPDTFSTATLQLYEYTEEEQPFRLNIKQFDGYAPPKKDHDLDFIFEKNLQFPYLHKKHALEFIIEPQNETWTSLKYGLTSGLSDIRTALFQLATGRLDIDPEIPGKRRLSRTLVETAKGWLPLKKDLCLRLHQNFKENFPAHSWTDKLHSTTLTHCRNQPLAILAVVFNSMTFLGHEKGIVSAWTISQKTFEGPTFLEQAYRTATLPGVGFPLVQDLMVLHAHLGLDKTIKIKKRIPDEFVEFRYYPDDSKFYISTFVDYSPETALDNLLASDNEAVFQASAQWLEHASLGGIALPDTCFDKLEQLFKHSSPDIKSLAFYLLLKKHFQMPAEGNIENLLLQFAALIKILPNEKLSRHGARLFQVLARSPCNHSALSMVYLREQTLSLCSKKLFSTKSFADYLYKTGDFDLRKIALKILLEIDFTALNKSAAKTLLLDLAQNDPQKGIMLFFYFSAYFSSESSLSTLLSLLGSVKDKKQWSSYKEKLASYLSETRKQTALTPASVRTVLPLLKKIDPSFDLFFSPAVSKKSPDRSEQLSKLKSEIEQAPSLSACKQKLLLLLQLGGDKTFHADLLEILASVFSKYAGEKLELFRLLTNKEIKSILDSDPNKSLEYVKQFADIIEASDNKVRMDICDWLASLLASCSEGCAEFAPCLGQLLKLMEQVDYSFLHSAARKSLSLSLSTIVLKLNQQGQSVNRLVDLLETSFRMGILPSVEDSVAAEIAVKIGEIVPGSDQALLEKSDRAFQQIKDRISSPVNNKCKEETIAIFVRAYLKEENQKNAFKWALQLTVPSQEIIETANFLGSKDLWGDVEKLLKHKNSSLFDEKDRLAFWLKLVEVYATKEPQRSIGICIDQKALFEEHIEGSQLEDLLTNLAQQMLGLRSLIGIDLCISLLAHFPLSSPSLWDTAIAAGIERETKQRIEKAWNALKTHGQRTSSPAAKCNLMKRLYPLKIYDPSLQGCLAPGAFETSPYFSDDENANSEIAKAIFNNALLGLSDPQSTIDFECLNSFGIQYIQERVAGDNIQLWVEHANVSQQISCLKYLQKKSDQAILIPTILSPEFLASISNAVQPPHDFSLYKYFLSILAADEVKNILEEKDLTAILTNIIPPSLEEAIIKRDTHLALQALLCFNKHQPLLSTFENMNEPLTASAVQALSLLLDCGYDEASYINDFEKVYETIFTNILPNDFANSFENVITYWKINLSFINGLLDINGSNFPSLKYITDLVYAHLLTTINCIDNSDVDEKKISRHVGYTVVTPNSMMIRNVVATLKKYVFSALFCPENESEQLVLEKSHLTTGAALYALALERKLFLYQPHLKDEIQVFLGMNIHKNYSATTVINVLLELLNDPTILKIRRAYITFNNSIDTLAMKPTQLSALFTMMISNLNSLIPEASYKIEWLKKHAYPFILNYHDKISKERPKDPKAIAKWEEQTSEINTDISELISSFMQALNGIRTQIRVTLPINIPKELYETAFLPLLLMLNNQLIPLNSEAFQLSLLGFLQIATDYTRGEHERKLIEASASIILRKYTEAVSPLPEEQAPPFEGTLKLLKSNTPLQDISILILAEGILEAARREAFQKNLELYKQAILQFTLLLVTHQSELKVSDNEYDFNLLAMPERITDETIDQQLRIVRIVSHKAKALIS